MMYSPRTILLVTTLLQQWTAGSLVLAIDTTLIPRLTDQQRQAVVGVYHRASLKSGTGFLIDRQPTSNGYRYLVLTADHVTDQGVSQVELTSGKVNTNVRILHAWSDVDLSLLELTTTEKLPTLRLASGGYSIPVGTPVLAVGKASDRLLEHVGTFQGTSSEELLETSGEYLTVACYTPPGFSGGPYLVVNSSNGELLVIGVIARTDVVHSYGPAISEVQRFLASAVSPKVPHHLADDLSTLAPDPLPLVPLSVPEDQGSQSKQNDPHSRWDWDSIETEPHLLSDLNPPEPELDVRDSLHREIIRLDRLNQRLLRLSESIEHFNRSLTPIVPGQSLLPEQPGCSIHLLHPDHCPDLDLPQSNETFGPLVTEHSEVEFSYNAPDTIDHIPSCPYGGCCQFRYHVH